MPRKNPRQFCKVCHQHRSVVGEMSTRGKCQLCAVERIDANIRQINAHSGPWFQHWRRQMAASVGGRLLDDHSGTD